MRLLSFTTHVAMLCVLALSVSPLLGSEEPERRNVSFSASELVRSTTQKGESQGSRLIIRKNQETIFGNEIRFGDIESDGLEVVVSIQETQANGVGRPDRGELKSGTFYLYQLKNRDSLDMVDEILSAADLGDNERELEFVPLPTSNQLLVSGLNVDSEPSFTALVQRLDKGMRMISLMGVLKQRLGDGSTVETKLQSVSSTGDFSLEMGHSHNPIRLRFVVE